MLKTGTTSSGSGLLPEQWMTGRLVCQSRLISRGCQVWKHRRNVDYRA